MIQTNQGICQAAYSVKPHNFVELNGMLFSLIDVARDWGRSRETSAIAVIYQTRSIMPPIRRKKLKSQYLDFPTDNQFELLAESREGECSITLKILRDKSHAFAGFREIQVPPLRDTTADQIGCDGTKSRDQESLKESRFGLLNKIGLPAAEIWKPKTRSTYRERRQSKQELPKFDVRMLPNFLPSPENDGTTCNQ